MSRKVLGIDIRNETVTAVLLQSSLREHRVEDFIHLPFSGPEDPERSLSSALQTLTEKMDLTGSDYVVSIPANQVIFRNLKIPFSNSKKIRMVLPFELETTLPYAAEDLVIDFQTLNGTPAGDKTELIAAAIEKSKLSPYLDALATIQADPEKLTLGGLPTALCLANLAEPEEDQLFVEIDDTYGTLFVMAGGRLQLIRSFPLPPAGPSKVPQLCAQIQQTLAAFLESSQLNFEPIELVANGIGLDKTDIIPQLSRALDIPVKNASIADRLDIPIESNAESTWIPAQMDNALALALMEVEGYAGLNFHKGQFAAQKFLAKHKGPLIKTGILAAAVLVLFFFNLMMEAHMLNKHLSRIDSQMAQVFKATFPAVKSIRYPYQEMQAKIQETKKTAAFEAEAGPHIRSIDILNSISEQIPESITVNLTRLVIQPDNVVISGTTDTYNSVDGIKGRLEKVPQFEKVTISSSNIDRSGNEVRFILKVEL
ncbi:MAG: type II secretion system protein GspL [Desulfobacterales bacterium]